MGTPHGGLTDRLYKMLHRDDRKKPLWRGSKKKSYIYSQFLGVLSRLQGGWLRNTRRT